MDLSYIIPCMNKVKKFNGELLCRLRKEANLLQSELANKFGLNKASISNMETGKLQPGADLARKFADFFKVELAILYKDEGADSNGLSSEEAELIRVFRKLPEIAKKDAMLFIQTTLSAIEKYGVR